MADNGRNDGNGGSSNTSRRLQSKLKRRRRDSRRASDTNNSTRADHLVVNDPVDKDKTPITSNASIVPNDVNLIVQPGRGDHLDHGGDADSLLGDSISAYSSVSSNSSVSSVSASSKMFFSLL